jgi:hypothetical protein
MLFTIVLAGHIVVALICVIAGAVAILSPKRRGRHPRCGTVYYGLRSGRKGADQPHFLLGCHRARGV